MEHSIIVIVSESTLVRLFALYWISVEWVVDIYRISRLPISDSRRFGFESANLRLAAVALGRSHTRCITCSWRRDYPVHEKSEWMSLDRMLTVRAHSPFQQPLLCVKVSHNHQSVLGVRVGSSFRFTLTSISQMVATCSRWLYHLSPHIPRPT